MTESGTGLNGRVAAEITTAIESASLGARRRIEALGEKVGCTNDA